MKDKNIKTKTPPSAYYDCGVFAKVIQVLS
jgi:hypothetical protein